jgi:hypothetical protein
MLRQIAFLLILSTSTPAFSQSITREAVASAGETLYGPGLEISFILGDVVGDVIPPLNTFSFLTFGFIQPDFELKEVADRYLSVRLLAIPNPTTDGRIKLIINELPEGPYSIDLIDGLGRRLRSGYISYSMTRQLYYDFSLINLPAGVYYITVTSDLHFTKVRYRGTVKVIKR